MKLGSTILYQRIPSFLSWVQRFVLKTPYSHSSIIAGFMLNNDIELEADIKVRLHSYGHSDKYRDVYELVDDVTYAVAHDVLVSIRQEFEGETYGFISWPAILIRRIFEIVLPKKYSVKVKGWDILWGWGVICSELVWYFYKAVADAMIERGFERWTIFLEELLTYNPNLFHPKDISYLLNKYNNLFKRRG